MLIRWWDFQKLLLKNSLQKPYSYWVDLICELWMNLKSLDFLTILWKSWAWFLFRYSDMRNADCLLITLFIQWLNSFMLMMVKYTLLQTERCMQDFLLHRSCYYWPKVIVTSEEAIADSEVSCASWFSDYTSKTNFIDFVAS